MPPRYRLLPLLAAALLAGCGDSGQDGPIAASIVGAPPAIVDPDRKPIDPPTAALLAATAQGLVRFDGGGQIEPGLAARWAVSDDGLAYTFRLVDDSPIDAEKIARTLRLAISPASRNPLKPLLTAIEEIVAVTPEVIEIRLSRAQPGLLDLLARPELALLADGNGSGPLRLAMRQRDALLLEPVAPESPTTTPADAPDRNGEVRLRGERAARAVARFAAGDARFVGGGSFVDLAIARAASPRPGTLRFDPAPGLLGFRVESARGILADPLNRRALAMAIDRDAIARLFAVDAWQPATTLLPAGLADLPDPATPDWASAPRAVRELSARAAVAVWIGRQGPPPPIRIALPVGPGANLLYRVIATGWARIGITTTRVAPDANADLRLIDAVAPVDNPIWYLAIFACGRGRPCSTEADAALAASDARAAGRLLGDAQLFLPIARPLRWSLVDLSLTGFHENGRAVHPIDRLRDPR